MTENSSKPIGQVAGYRLLERIAQGGMGSVYKAVQISIDRIVAVKLLSAKYASDSVFVERFLREARAAARLNHPNIVQAIDVGRADDHYYFVMEYVEGPTLAALLKERGTIPPPEAIEIIKHVARGLENAGRMNMLHLDVKPANILIAPNGLAKLGDFGLARHVEDEDTIYAAKKVVFGTPSYMAPEQINSMGDLDSRCDIWSLGVTFQEIVTGQNPFAGPDQKTILRNVLAAKKPLAHEANPDVSEHISLVIAKMTAQNREERYSNPDTLLVDLDALARNDPPPIALKLSSVPPPQATQPESPPKRAPSIALFAAIGIFAILALFASFFFNKNWFTNTPSEQSSEENTDLKDSRVARAFRECVGKAEAARVEGNFAEAIALYNTFIEENKNSQWAEQAQAAANDVRNQATNLAQELVQSVQSAIQEKDFQSAEKRIEEIENIGLPETQSFAGHARKRLDMTLLAEKAAAEKARNLAAAKAFEQLQRQVDRLNAQEKFSAALEACDAFLSDETYSSSHLAARLLQVRCRSLILAQDAILQGTRKAIGSQVEFGTEAGRITGVKSGSIIARVNGTDHTLRLSDLSPEDIGRLADKADAVPESLPLDIALLLYVQERYIEALNQLADIGNGIPSELAPVYKKIEQESLLKASQEAITNGTPQKAIAFLRQLQAKYSRSPFYRGSRPHIKATFNRARQAFYSTMCSIRGGHFIYRRNTRFELPLYYMDTHEVTNAEYARFLEDISKNDVGPYEHPGQPTEKKNHTPLGWEKLSQEHPNHPVTGVDWYDAYAYAQWCGKRLPSEVEWEKAARGENGYKYPWGNSWKNDLCNSRPAVVVSSEGVSPSVADVGSFPKGNSPYGCADMAGNVREWATRNTDDSDTTQSSPVRGGSYKDLPAFCTTTTRIVIDRLTRDTGTGFRCVADPVRDMF